MKILTEPKLALLIFMNLKVKPSPFLKGFFVSILVMSFFWLVVFIVSFPYIYEGKKANGSTFSTDQFEQDKTITFERKKTFEELSPDGEKKIIRYESDYLPELFSNDYKTYLNNKVIIALVENVNYEWARESYILVGEERTDNPHWLGNKFIFFSAHCGSSCQRWDLLDIETGQRRTAILANIPRSNDEFEFRWSDWFDGFYAFDDILYNPHAEMIDNFPYLIFDSKNTQGVENGQKKFLFKGDALILKP